MSTPCEYQLFQWRTRCTIDTRKRIQIVKSWWSRNNIIAVKYMISVGIIVSILLLFILHNEVLELLFIVRQSNYTEIIQHLILIQKFLFKNCFYLSSYYIMTNHKQQTQTNNYNLGPFVFSLECPNKLNAKIQRNRIGFIQICILDAS